MAVLRLELWDAFKHLHNTRLHIFNISKRISYFLPPTIENSFFVRQEMNNRHFHHHERIRINKKIKGLIHKRDIEIKSKIRPIHFCSSLHPKLDPNNSPFREHRPCVPRVTSDKNLIHTSQPVNPHPHIFPPSHSILNLSSTNYKKIGWLTWARHKFLSRSSYYCSWGEISVFR